MSVTKWCHPTSADLGQDWSSPANAEVDDTAVTSPGSDGHFNDWWDFKNNTESSSLDDLIPAEVEAINGIEVRIRAYENPTEAAVYVRIRLSHDGRTTFTTEVVEDSRNPVSGEYTATAVQYISGHSSSKFGRSWSRSEFSDANFGFRLVARGSFPGDSQVEFIELRVHYTEVVKDVAPAVIPSKVLKPQRAMRINANTDDFIRTTRMPPVNYFTMSAWIKIDNIFGGQFNVGLFHGNQTNYLYLGFDSGGNFEVGSTGDNSEFTNDPVVGQWYFMVMLCYGADATDGFAYLFDERGFIEVQNALDGPPDSGGDSAQWGCSPWNEGLDGLYAQLGYWDRPLTFLEIQAVHKSTPLAVPRGLIGHYPLDGNFKDSLTGIDIDTAVAGLEFDTGKRFPQENNIYVGKPENRKLVTF